MSTGRHLSFNTSQLQQPAKVRLLELRNTYKWGGGPDKTILLSAERHDRSRVEVTVAYIRDVRDHEFSIGEKARVKGLTFYEVEERGKLDLRVLIALRDIVIRHDINLVHGHDHKSDLFAFLLRQWLFRRRIRLMSTAHAWVMLGLKGELYRRMDLSLMRYFDHLIAVSQATKEEMIATGIPCELITVVHNGIDTEAWAPKHLTRTLREELDLGSAFPVIGYVGRIMPEKNLETWLRAAAIVAKQFPAAQFVLVGDGRNGETLGEIKHLATQLGIADRTHFPGYKSDLIPIYSAFDIFLLTSRREGLPNSILEAMALGLPVVTTDVAGAKELVLDRETGRILAQGDAEGLGEALIELASNRTLRTHMGQTGRERIQKHFSFSERLKKIESLYEQVVDLGCRTTVSKSVTEESFVD